MPIGVMRIGCDNESKRKIKHPRFKAIQVFTSAENLENCDLQDFAIVYPNQLNVLLRLDLIIN